MSCLDQPPLPPASKIVWVAAAALIDRDGRVLLAERPAGKEMEGFWEFPGGKIESGETPEETLIRELKEELGVDISSFCLAPVTFASHRYKNMHLVMPLYVCRNWNGHITPKEKQKLAWVYPKDLNGYKILEADIPLIPALQDLL